MDDPRYSELLFLRELSKGPITFHDAGGAQAKAVGMDSSMYVEMAATLVEDLFVAFDRDDVQLIVSKLRGETSLSNPNFFHPHEWHNPRQTLHYVLAGFHHQGLQRVRITYRGLRRIEELRDLLRRDRILEPFGILLDKRYFLRDLEQALSRGPETTVSVIYADMDNFKTVNTTAGHSGGDVVMKAYLEVVRDSIGEFGTAYRGLGDETVSLIIDQSHERAAEIAENIRTRIAEMRCEHNGKRIPKVTAGIGVASTPPEARSADIETIADSRNQKAKDTGKNKVVSI
jgi:diguanylate cyclase (GGDEF)-like protein